ncbi:MAG: alanine/ornithine racemase family PLP-dependent enzyme, partial [Bacilli bacterium]
MKYPCIEVDLSKIKYNTKKVLDSTAKHGINISCVTKVVAGDKKIMETVIDAGVYNLADSRIANFKNFIGDKVKKLLIRIPMESEAEEVVLECDATLISELETAKKLSEYCEKHSKLIDVILMFDLGDLREGCFDIEDLINTAKVINSLPHINLFGIGSNFACYGGIKPTIKNLTQLCEAKTILERELNIELSVVSPGSSNCLHLLGEMPSCINHLRVGSTIFCGTGLNDVVLDGYYYDIFKLKAQIVELKTKPSVPIGESCLNAFGKEVKFEDKGEILRAIVAVGRQDVDIEELIPIDNNIEILGSSSDHIVLEVPSYYKLGDIITFNLTYPGCLKSMTSKYLY